jgi:hypothetical protein
VGEVGGDLQEDNGMRNQPLLQGLWLRDWFAHAPDDSTSASKISDQHSPIRNREHRFSNILINRVRVASSRTSIRIFSERCSRLRIGDC